MDERIEILLKVNDQASRILLQFTKTLDRSARLVAKSQDQLGRATKRSAEGMRRADREARKLSTSMARLDRRAARAGASFRQLFLGVSGFVILRGAIRTMAEFEQTMLAVGAVLGKTTEDIQPLIKQARFLGATTRFTANQAAEAILNLSRAGFTMAESLRASGPALDLAVAGFLDLGTAASFVVSSVRQFGLSAADAGNVADILVKAANSANVTVQDLGESLKLAGPIAKQAGVSLEATAAALGLLGDAGLRGTLAGTGLRRTFIGLLQDSDKVRDTLKGMGLTLADVNVRTEGLAVVFARLREKNLSVLEAVRLFSIRGATAALILKEFANVLKQDEEALRKADGEARRISRTIEDSLFGAIRRTTAALQEFVIAAGDKGMAGVLRGMFETIAEVVRVLSGFEGSIERASNLTLILADTLRAIPWIVGAAAAGKLIGALWGIVAAARAATGAMGAFTAVTAANPWAAIAIAITGVVFAFNAFAVAASRAGDAARRARLDAEDFAKSTEKIAESLEKLRKARAGTEGFSEVENAVTVSRAIKQLITDLEAARNTVQGLAQRTLTAEEFGKIVGFDPSTIKEFAELTKKTAQRLKEEILDEFNFDSLSKFNTRDFRPIKGFSFSGINRIVKQFGVLKKNAPVEVFKKFDNQIKAIGRSAESISGKFEKLTFINREQRKAVEELTSALSVNARISKRDFDTALDSVVKRLQEESVEAQKKVTNLEKVSAAEVASLKASQLARQEIIERVKALKLELDVSGKTVKEKKLLTEIDQLTTLAKQAGNKASVKELQALKLVVPLLINQAAAREADAAATKEQNEARKQLAGDVTELRIRVRLLQEEVKNGKAAAQLLLFQIRAKALNVKLDEDEIKRLLEKQKILEDTLRIQRRGERSAERGAKGRFTRDIGLDPELAKREIELTGFLIDQPTEAQFFARFDVMRDQAAERFATGFGKAIAPGVEGGINLINDLFNTNIDPSVVLGKVEEAAEATSLAVQKALQINARPEGLEIFATSFALQMEQIGNQMVSLFELGRTVADRLVGAFDGAFSSFADDIINDFDNIDEAFRNLSKNLLKNLAKLLFDIAQQALVGGIIKAIFGGVSGGLFGSLFGGGGGGGVGGQTGLVSGQNNPLTFLENARGNVFKGGQIVPFQQGGVVDQFTTFPLAGNKVGGAGEGGAPEGILPLLRGRGGRLGVEVMNPNQLGGGTVNTTNVIVNNSPTINTNGSREDAASALRESNRELERIVDSRVAKKFRDGAFRSKVAQAGRSR